MDRLNLGRGALSVCVAAALLAGCGGSQLPIGAPGALARGSELVARPNSARYKVVYSFANGIQPVAPLIDVGGTLYGTTNRGGSNKQRGCG